MEFGLLSSVLAEAYRFRNDTDISDDVSRPPNPVAPFAKSFLHNVLLRQPTTFCPRTKTGRNCERSDDHGGVLPHRVLFRFQPLHFNLAPDGLRVHFNFPVGGGLQLRHRNAKAVFEMETLAISEAKAERASF